MQIVEEMKKVLESETQLLKAYRENGNASHDTISHQEGRVKGLEQAVAVATRVSEQNARKLKYAVRTI